MGAIESPSVQLSLRPDTTPLWRTVVGGPRWIEWVMPPKATKATLTVDSAFHGRTVFADLTAPSNLVNFAVAVSDDTEDVVTLTLAFDSGETQSVKLGVIRSVCETPGATASAVCRCVDGMSGKWNRVRGQAVLPVPCGTESFVIRDETVDTGLNGAAGWHGATFSSTDRPVQLTLETDDGVFAATLNYYAGGLVLSFR